MSRLYALAFASFLVVVLMSIRIHDVPPVDPQVEAKAAAIVQAGQSIRDLEQRQVIMEPPEVKRLKELVETFRQNVKGWDCVIAVADVYKSGAYPRFVPNEYMAAELYKIAAMCPDGNVAGLGQAKFIECRSESVLDVDKKGAELPEEPGKELCRLAMDRIKNTPFLDFEKPKMLHVERQETPRIEIPRYDIPDFRFVTRTFDMETPEANPHARQYMRDNQNVHDHSVVAVMRKNLKRLTEEQPAISDGADTVVYKVREAVLTSKEMKTNEKSDALLVLEDLNDNTHGGFGTSERDILRTVWCKIDAEQDATLRDNLIDSLGKQLASGVENGSVVCSTGKISRIIGTLEGTADAETSKPLWAVKEEIATLASKIRDDKLNALNDFDKRAYEQGSMPHVEHDMKQELMKQGMTLYCKELGMNDKIIEPMLQTYAEAY